MVSESIFSRSVQNSGMNKEFIEQLHGGGEARVGDLAVLPEDCRPGELGQGDRLGRGRREWKKSCVWGVGG